MKSKQTSLHYKPVKEGGLVNHYQFYVLYLSVSLVFYFGLLWAVVNAEKIDGFFYDLFKSIFI